jgi:hypothetical protein
MPEIIVKAGSERDEQAAVLLRERITADVMEGDHYAAQLIDRLRWAVLDATAAQEAGREGEATG